ncbi:MAG TPA: phosphotransferase [Chloroflexota bacterium]|nr:phosphotransferase [Chloroflexota bacterium]
MAVHNEDGIVAFDRLTYRGKLHRLRRLARQALLAYGLGDARLTPLRHAPWSTTFRVDVASPRCRYVLRIHGSELTDAAEARSELLWLAALRRDTDLAVPEPIATPDGALTVAVEANGVPGPRQCVLLRWLDGRFLSPATSLPTVRQVGQFMARLHLHAERFAPPPGFQRQRLDPSDILQQAPPALLGRGILTADAVAVVAAAAHRLRDEVRALAPTPATFGLIHADLHVANLLVHRGRVCAIDYGDCAFGPFAYDIAVWLVILAHRDWPAQEEKQAAFFAGYRSVRSLPPEQREQIGTCMAWRRLQDLDVPVALAEDPRFRARFASALPEQLRALRRYADGDGSYAADGDA